MRNSVKELITVLISVLIVVMLVVVGVLVLGPQKAGTEVMVQCPPIAVHILVVSEKDGVPFKVEVHLPSGYFNPENEGKTWMRCPTVGQ